MKLSKAQMDAPFQQDRHEMAKAIVTWWVDNEPEIVLDYSPELLGEMARAAHILANRYGIKRQPEVCAFANLMWLFGPSFDQHGPIRAVLDQDLDEEAKVEALYTEVPDAVWDAASEARDEGRWLAILAEG